MDNAFRVQVGTWCSQYRRNEITGDELFANLLSTGMSEDDAKGYVKACLTLQAEAQANAPATGMNDPVPPDMPPLPDEPIPIPGLPDTSSILPGPVPQPPPEPGVLPPLPIPTVIPTQCPHIDFCALTEAINGITSVFNAINTQVRGRLINQIEPQRKLINEIIAPIIGKIINTLDSQTKITKTIEVKIKKKLVDQMGNCYAECFPLGFQYPSDSDVLYGLESGDCLGTCFAQAIAEASAEATGGTAIAEATCPPVDVQVNVSSPIVQVQTGDQTVSVTVSPGETTIGGQTQSQTQETEVTEEPEKEVPCPENEPWLQSIIDGISSQVRSGLDVYKLQKGSDNGQESSFLSILARCLPGVCPPPPPPPFPPPPPPPPGDLPPAGVPKKELDIKPGSATEKRVPDWQHPGVCEELAKAAADGEVDRVVGFYIDKDKRRIVPQWWYNAWGMGSWKDWTAIKKMGEGVLWSIIHGGKDLIKHAHAEIKEVFRCSRLPIDAILAKLLGGFISNWTAGSLDGLLLGWTYKLNEGCPQAIPSQENLDGALLADQMGEKQWECLTRANNNLPELAKRVLYSKRDKISFHDAYMLYRLGRMKEIDYREWCKQNGILTDADRKAKEAAAIALPGQSDLIRMMVRDVADPDIVKKFDLDAEFPQKWQGELEQMGQAQGIDREIAKLLWRAHWDSPSSFQGFEMLHRLRPDSPLVEEWAAILVMQSQGALTLDEARGMLVTSSDDIAKLLEVNDMLPFWRARMMAISYRPLTRTDAQRAFIIGALDEAGLLGVFQDEGYTLANSQILVAFTKLIKQEREVRKLGARPIGKIKAAFIRGELSEARMNAEIRNRIPYKPKADAAIEDAILERQLRERQEQTACARQAFVTGKNDQLEILDSLTNLGYSPGEAKNLRDRWLVCMGTKGKLATAAQLCKWRELNLIDRADQLRRLTKLGWSVQDATFIADQCEKSMSEAAKAKLERELRQIEKENKAILRESEKLKKELQKKQAAADKANARAQFEAGYR